MRQYIGTKLVEAEPAWRITPPEGKPYITRKDENSCCPANSSIEDGYKVVYPDGYESWSPKEVFEKAYLELDVNQELRTDAPSISQKMVDQFIVATEATTMGTKCTVVRAVLRNGFEIVESSACVSAENYDQELGAKICLEKIKDKIWFLLGFLLQTAVTGVDGVDVLKDFLKEQAEEAAQECCGEPQGLTYDMVQKAAQELQQREDDFIAGRTPCCGCCGIEAPNTSMDFGGAIGAMRDGLRVRRRGWNGKGIHIEMQFPDEHSKMTRPYIFIDTTGLQTENPDAPKDRVPWLASQTDMLAEDWEIVI